MKKKTKVIIICAAAALLIIAAVLVIPGIKGGIAEDAVAESVSAAAGKMEGTTLGNEDEVSGADWYEISGGNRLITVSFPEDVPSGGCEWSVTILDEDAVMEEEEIREADRFTALIRATGDKDAETSVYFDYKTDSGAEPKYIKLLKVRTEGDTIRVIGVEETR